jgi:hypothetical protein
MYVCLPKSSQIHIATDSQLVLVSIPESDRVAQLYLHAPSSLFVAFYCSQGYGGGTLTCLHMRTRLQGNGRIASLILTHGCRWM